MTMMLTIRTIIKNMRIAHTFFVELRRNKYDVYEDSLGKVK